MRFLIIGGVAGGATVAARLRRLDENAEIVLIERGQYVSYANCGLPYYIGDTIQDRNNLFVQSIKGLTDRYRIEIRAEQEVTKILTTSKQVEIKNRITGEIYTDSYDKLVLSPGAEPLRPRIEGIESGRIFTLRNVPDTDRIKAYVNATRPRSAIVVGGGFIGLEMAENLRSRGIRRINIHRRGFPASAEQIARTLGVTPGGVNDLFVLTLDGQPTALFVDRID